MTSTRAPALTDIDIDFPDRDAAVAALSVIPAMQIAQGRKVRHPSGVYFQDVPYDPITGLCALDHKQAAEHGYFKIDCLPNHLYGGIESEAQLDALLAREPEWSLLEFEPVVTQMNHIHNHFDIVQAIKPTSIEDLAIVLALIRPGKRYLLNQSREIIDRELWLPSADGYTFKRSHAIAFAASLVVQLNMIQDRMLAELEQNDDDIFVFNKEA